MADTQATIITTLEHALAKARAGDLTCLALAAAAKNGDAVSAVVVPSGAPVFTLLGVSMANVAEIERDHITAGVRSLWGARSIA